MYLVSLSAFSAGFFSSRIYAIQFAYFKVGDRAPADMPKLQALHFRFTFCPARFDVLLASLTFFFLAIIQMKSANFLGLRMYFSGLFV